MLDKIDNHVMVKYSQYFRELCEPIFRSSPICYIGLARIYSDGKRSYLITDPEWGKILLKNKYHLIGTEDALIHGPESSYQFWFASSMFTLNQQTQNLLTDCIANNYGNGMTLIERGKDFVEFIHICAKSGYEKLDPYLTSNVDLIWKYIFHIRELIAEDSVLKNAYNEKYQYNIIVPNTKYMHHNDLKLTIKKYYLGGYFDDIYFTSKDILCLVLLYRRKTPKQIAQQLNLSPRTIESRFEGIRIKALCSTKTELILELSHNNSFKSLEKTYVF